MLLLNCNFHRCLGNENQSTAAKREHGKENTHKSPDMRRGGTVCPSGSRDPSASKGGMSALQTAVMLDGPLW